MGNFVGKGPGYFVSFRDTFDYNNLIVILGNTRKLQTNNYLAQIILMVRSDPVEQIRNVLEQVAAARGLTQVHNEQSYGKTENLLNLSSIESEHY